MSKLRDVLEHVERYGELRDFCGTRYERDRRLAPAIRRRLIRVEARRGRYELTPAGRRRLDAMRSRTPRRTVAVRCGILSCLMSLVIAGLYLGGLRLPIGGMVPGTATGSQPSPDKAPTMVGVIDDLKVSLPADSEPHATGPGHSTPAPTPRSDSAMVPPSSSATEGNPTGAAASGDDVGQRVTRTAKKRRRAPAPGDRRERVGESGASGHNAPLFGELNLRRGRSPDSGPGPSTPYRDDRYPAAPLR
jgi:hypothetical protein